MNQLNYSIDTEMIHKAQEKIFLLVQAESFANEIKQLKSEKKMVPESSGTSHLDPFLNNRDILRVGWRFRKSSLTEEENHPVILSKKCVMLIPSPWHFVDSLWLEEEQSVQFGRTMEQILWVPGMNYSEHSKR